MKLAALFSGGKDSTASLYKAMQDGHGPHAEEDKSGLLARLTAVEAAQAKQAAAAQPPARIRSRLYLKS